MTASASSDFHGRTLLSRVADKRVSATSAFNVYTGPEKAVDGNPNTEWRVATGVTSATLQLSLPVNVNVSVGVEVDEIRIVQDYRASLNQVQIDLLGDVGQVLDSRTEPFGALDAALTIVVEPAVDGVYGLALLFDGDAIRVREIEVFGATTVDLGSALQDVTFAGTAGIRVEATRASGEGLQSGIFARDVPTGSQVVNATTGDDGIYALLAPLPADIGPIDFTLTAMQAVVGHPFLRATGQATVTADTTTVLKIVFPETASISGRVTSFAGTPVSNQWVSLFPSSGPGYSKSTDAGGFFVHENLPADTYTLRIVRNGRFVYSPPIELSPPSSHVENLQIPSFGTIDLTVLAATPEGTPAQPVLTTVKVVDVLGARSFATNASGQKTITNVAGPSPFTLEVPHPSDTSNVTIETGAIATDGDIVAVTVVIPALGTVGGGVSFANGSAAAAAAVELSGTDLSGAVTPRIGTTNTLGSYSFAKVEGLLSLSVVARHPALDRSHIFAVASGEVPGNGEAATINVALPGTGTVEVTVTEFDGTTPIPGASVSILDSFSSAFRSEGPTGSDGTRTVTIVPEGSFTVRAEVDGNEMGTAVGNIPAGAVGTLVAVTISRPPEATVEGTVFAADGITPVAGATVRLLTADDATEIASRAAGADGFYRFAYALPVGESSIVRAELPSDATVSDEALVTATTAGDTIVSDLVLPAKVIAGRVLDSDQLTPVIGANVDAVLEGSYSDGANVTLSDANGSFTIVGLAEGGYELVARGPDGLQGYAFVVLGVGDDTVEQDVTLPAFGVVEGTVLDTTGAPPPGIETGEVALQNANVDPPRTASPDASGFYRFARVAEGAFTVVYDDASSSLSGATTSFVAAGENLGELTNIARAFGVTANASSSYGAAYAPDRVIDGNLSTTWYTASGDAAHLGGSPFLEVVFPADATVSELRMFGNRTSTRYDFLAGYFELFDESGTTLFDSGVFQIPDAARDVVVAAPDVAGVRRVRFTATDDESNFPSFAELEIFGQLTVVNLVREPGMSTSVSSAYPGYGAERAIDGNLATSWFTLPRDAVHLGANPFYEVVLPESAVVNEIQMFGNRQYANGYDFFAGRFELIDALGGVLFDSGIVALPAPDRDTVLAIPEVSGVTRVRFTPTDDQGSTPGFSELVVLGWFESPEAPTPDINLPDTGSVSGQLLTSDASPPPPAPVSVRSSELESRTGVVSKDGSVDGAGLYHVSGVAEGNVTVSIFDVGVGEAGTITATVQAGVETTELDVQLGTARVLPSELGLPVALRHFVQPDGSVHGELDTLGMSVELAAVSVNGKRYPEQNVAGVELSGRQLVLGPVRMSGLDHTRKVFVPADGRFARFLDVIENPHDFDVEVTVVFDGSLKASNLQTSSSDAELDRTDRYLAGELDTGPMAPLMGVGVVYAGSGSVRLPDAAATNGDAYALTWRNLVVPAGGRIIFLNFAVQAGTRAAALAEAGALLALTDPSATSDLSPAEKAAIVNFIIP